MGRSVQLTILCRKVIFLTFFIVANKAQTADEWKPNHVAINEQKKHIDVDTRWLHEKSGKPIEEVPSCI